MESFELRNYITSEKASLEPLLDLKQITKENVLEIKQIFNSESVFKMFNRSRKGKKFETSDVMKYLNWSVAQTLNGKNISYFVRDGHNVICGGLDLQKVNENTVTIGYWADGNKPGFITNAVNLLLDVAKNIGYVSIDAYPEKENIKSIRVLERTGFDFIEEIVKDDYVLMKYARLL